jgi:hypothetical protein
MDDNELDDLASRAGFAINMVGQIVAPAPTEDARKPLRMFAELLAAAERDRCAKPMEEAAAWLLKPKRTNEVDRHVAAILQGHAERIRGA